MTTTARKTRKQHAEAIESAQRACAMHYTLLQTAIGYEGAPETADGRTYYRGPESERQARSLVEWEHELEQCIEAAAAAGYTPEDFE
jgi:hypothetical protein